MEDSIGILKGNAARILLRNHIEFTGNDFVRTLSSKDLFHPVKTRVFSMFVGNGLE